MSEAFPPLVGFQSRKAAQITAYFATLAGGAIEKLKLIKLIYLSEREFMGTHGRPMLYDEFYSLKDGPICSAALNLINGGFDNPIWDDYITRNGNIVIPVKAVHRADLTEMSQSELDAVNAVWNICKDMSSSRIRNYTHEICKEYREVFSGRLPITYHEVFKALDMEDAESLSEEVENFRKFESAFLASSE